jgi:hypothetical protein
MNLPFGGLHKYGTAASAAEVRFIVACHQNRGCVYNATTKWQFDNGEVFATASYRHALLLYRRERNALSHRRLAQGRCR